MKSLTESERRSLAAGTVMLDGVSATITGVRNDFATIVARDGRKVDFAWSTVATVVATRNGSFRS